LEQPELVSRIAYGFDPSVPSPTYQDVSEQAQALRFRRGRENERQQPGASVAEITYRNNVPGFTPPALQLMTRVQHAAVWESVEYPLHTGHVERAPLEWLSEEESTVSATVVDMTSALQAALVWGDLPEELSGARVNRILDWIGQPSGAGPPDSGYWVLGTSALGVSTMLAPSSPTRVIDTGAVRVAAATINADSPRSALEVIQETAQAEGGVFFIDGQGRAVFRERHARFGQTAALTFTDDLATLTATRVKYQDLVQTYQIDQVVNEVSVSAQIGDEQVTVVSDDGDSRQQYWRRSAQLSLPLTTVSALRSRAALELLLYAQPAVRYERLTVIPAGQPAAWPALLGLEIGDMVEVERKGETRPVFVEAVDHDARPGGWRITFSLSPADAYTDVWVLGTSALGSTTRLAA
jgi:hypothetical protein